MLTMIKLLQINIGECHVSHDLLLATATQLEANIIIVSEPNRALGERLNGWHFDASEWFAIATHGCTAIEVIGPLENGFRWLEVAGIRINSYYWSPNLPLLMYEDFLYRLEQCIRSSKYSVIVARNMNVKSPRGGAQSKILEVSPLQN